jgi:hypothetical protein
MADESPEQRAAEAKLDEVTREVAADELEKETERETSWPVGAARGGVGAFGVLSWFRVPRLRSFRRVKGDPVAEPVNDPDPGDERGLRDALHERDDKE